jgi:hypothetical protein
MEFLLINHPLDCPICDQGGRAVPLSTFSFCHLSWPVSIFATSRFRKERLKLFQRETA